jgi:AraC-like DNA-binding protein
MVKVDGIDTAASVPSRGGDGFIHGGFLSAYVEAARRVDLEPFRHLRQARLPTNGFDDDAVLVPYARFISLLDRSACVSGREDFVLCVVEALSLSSLGRAALIASVQPRVRDVLEVIGRLILSPQLGEQPRIERQGARAVLRLAPKLAGSQPAVRAELAFGVVLRGLQAALGSDWRPLSVELTRQAPDDPAPYQALFGAVSFDRPFDAMIIEAGSLVRGNANANPLLARLIDGSVAQSQPAASFEEEVRAIIRALLPRGGCTAGRTAELLGVDRRTVHRRLDDRGVSFGGLMQSVREELIGASLSDRALPVATLAGLAGFSGTAAFSRWFRQRYGASPMRFRRAAA